MIGNVDMRPEPIIRINDLSISLPPRAERPFAVQNVSFDVYPGEILCIVGESGSGKSMASNAIMGLLPKPHVCVSQGQILFQGRDLCKLSDTGMQNIRGRAI